MSEVLELISCIRFMIAGEVVGTPGRTAGVIWTKRMSPDSHRRPADRLRDCPNTYRPSSSRHQFRRPASKVAGTSKQVRGLREAPLRRISLLWQSEGRCADEQFEGRLPLHALEINGLRQHVSEGIEVERIKLIWRSEVCHRFNEPKAG